ncbi:unnamed protein product, partial [Mesorhabditis belari]|uniref:Globin family profile domain-containing protein n=1 Tax=Mesorhabditis belari TaxID=2138241 RepID=A0AAF3J6Q5_9BILA
MEDPLASPSPFRRTQSCRVPRSQQSILRRGSKSNRSRSRGRNGGLSISSLTFSQRQALVASWRNIRPTANSVMRKIFLELEIACPKVKDLFYKAALVDAFNNEGNTAATLDEHVKMMVKLFDELVNTIDDEEQCTSQMKQVGCVHAMLSRSCGFSAEIWERLGEVAIERICAHEGVIKSREAARAWRTLIACSVDEMRSGFEGEARVFSSRMLVVPETSEKSSSTDALEMNEGEGSELSQRLQQLRIDFGQTYQM